MLRPFFLVDTIGSPLLSDSPPEQHSKNGQTGQQELICYGGGITFKRISL